MRIIKSPNHWGQEVIAQWTYHALEAHGQEEEWQEESGPQGDQCRLPGRYWPRWTLWLAIRPALPELSRPAAQAVIQQIEGGHHAVFARPVMAAMPCRIDGADRHGVDGISPLARFQEGLAFQQKPSMPEPQLSE